MRQKKNKEPQEYRLEWDCFYDTIVNQMQLNIEDKIKEESKSERPKSRDSNQT